MTDAILILDGGLQTTIQDTGRPGHEASGLARGGAADRTSLAVANLLAGNPVAAAAIEGMVVPPSLRAVAEVTIGIAGADLGYVLEPGGRRVVPPCVVRLRPGDRLVPDADAPGGPGRPGARVYLAPAGGVDVPVAIGSRATFLPAGFGGLEGRALTAGDVIRAELTTSVHRRALDVSEVHHLARTSPIRVLPGPAAVGRQGRAHLAALVGSAWTVSADSDRRGLRLRAAPPAPIAATVADRPSHGVVPGAIQLTPDGTPLVLMPDAGPTGGYPVVALVIAADLDRLGQLRPGATVEFVAVDRRTATAAEVERRAWLTGLDALAEGPRTAGPREDDTHARWDDAWRLAGA